MPEPDPPRYWLTGRGWALTICLLAQLLVWIVAIVLVCTRLVVTYYDWVCLSFSFTIPAVAAGILLYWVLELGRTPRQAIWYPIEIVFILQLCANSCAGIAVWNMNGSDSFRWLVLMEILLGLVTMLLMVWVGANMAMWRKAVEEDPTDFEVESGTWDERRQGSKVDDPPPH